MAFECFRQGSFDLQGIPPYLAASWFGSSSVSTVTAIAVFGNQVSRRDGGDLSNHCVTHQVGIALGFFIPTMLIPDVDDLNLIGQRLRILYYAVASVCVVCFIAMIIGRSIVLRSLLMFHSSSSSSSHIAVFRRLPPTPPSRAQEKALQVVEQNYGQTIKRLMTNTWFLLLLLSYGRDFLFP